MIAELLDLADRLEIPTPRPFERLPVHYFIDLDGDGKLLGITPAYGNTNDKTGEPELGKLMDCPVYFPLAIGTKGDIQASGGGGKSVAEAGHGDTKEVFCTDIKTPQGKSPKLQIMEPPPSDELESIDAETDPNEIEDEDDSDESEEQDTPKRKAKNYARHTGWIKLLARFYVSAEEDNKAATALRKFVDLKYRLDADVLEHFNLPNPDATSLHAKNDDEKRKVKSNATKARNAQLRQIANARFTFRINGQLLLKNQAFHEWWKKAYTDERGKMLDRLPPASDGFSRRDDRGSKCLTPVFPHIPKIPGGGMYCPLCSFDKAATQSFGLGKHTLSMSLTTTERAASALKWLLQDKRSSCQLGKKLVAIFWAVPPVKGEKPYPHDFAALMNEPDALQVLDFFHNLHGHAAVSPATAQFYCAILSSPKSRITVRSWHTQTLGCVTESAEAYFKTVSLPAVFRGGELTASTIGELAAATIPPQSESGPPSTAYSRILQTALFGTLLPHAFLESALTRQSLELANGRTEGDKGKFESRLRARTALIKLYFKKNKDITMNEQTHENQSHPAYLCGRVLAQLDRIHNEAHGKSTASSPADRYYGSASSTPALVFPRLCKLARIHLAAVRKDPKRGWLAPSLDKDLTGLIAKFNDGAAWPRTLSLEDQGRFAIGFYYQRAPKGSEPTTNDSQTNDDSNKS